MYVKWKSVQASHFIKKTIPLASAKNISYFK